ncbi:hypothetical protein FLONG3_471 [Fusarium longipes]|uniref:Uncharacterized protein n=1 Tax=Fusarium longipes TaxID=694270 RepID=A0A395T9Z5_9HYPO|nr:hypothetical protein FLONG3_471 [Fusarium longipes]
MAAEIVFKWVFKVLSGACNIITLVEKGLAYAKPKKEKVEDLEMARLDLLEARMLERERIAAQQERAWFAELRQEL